MRSAMLLTPRRMRSAAMDLPMEGIVMSSRAREDEGERGMGEGREQVSR